MKRSSDIRISCILALGLLLLLPQAMKAQTSSPYSMYGYGVLGDYATSHQRQMGSVGYAMNSGRQINVMNPASYAFADSLTFLWDVGADLCFLNSRQAATADLKAIKESSKGGGLDYVTMKVPLGHNFGASLGLLPRTSVGYAFGSEIEHGALENQGHGGINELYLGLAGRWKGLALGANFSYQFGNIVNDVYSKPENTGRTLFEHVMQIRDWNVNVGLQYSQNITKADRITLGVTCSPKKTLHGNTWVTTQQLESDGSSQVSLPDTVSYSRLHGKYYQPNTIGAGINYTRNHGYRLTVEADFTWQDWSKAEYSALYDSKQQVVFQGLKFNNRVRGALGAEFVARTRGTYLERIAWRLGGSYGQDYLKIAGNDIKDLTLSLGLGLPTPAQRTEVNIGFEWRHRTASPAKLVTENYFNIMLGINFNETWFWQRKIK